MILELKNLKMAVWLWIDTVTNTESPLDASDGTSTLIWIASVSPAATVRGEDAG